MHHNYIIELIEVNADIIHYTDSREQYLAELLSIANDISALLCWTVECVWHKCVWPEIIFTTLLAHNQ